MTVMEMADMSLNSVTILTMTSTMSFATPKSRPWVRKWKAQCMVPSLLTKC